MKYRCELKINLPRERVVELFDSTENLKKWQPGLISFEHIEGTPGEVGAKSKLKYKMGKKEVEMIETITSKNLPDEFSGTYEAKGVFNIVKNYFEPVGEDKTKYITEQEFQLSGFMKIIGFLMPGAFKKETMKYMKLFKEFCENEGTANG